MMGKEWKICEGEMILLSEKLLLFFYCFSLLTIKYFSDLCCERLKSCAYQILMLLLLLLK